MAKTLLENEWDAHVVYSEASRLALLYIDCHLFHQPRFEGASVLLARTNFGCGSSREHAPWALQDYGFCSIVAPSFADIFYNNCFKNGMLPIRLPEAQIAKLFQECAAHPGYQLTVDLERQTVEDNHNNQFTFEVDAFKRDCLLRGLDDIAMTLEHESSIRGHEASRRVFS